MSGSADIRVGGRDVDVPRFRPVRVKIAGGTPREQVRRGDKCGCEKGRGRACAEIERHRTAERSTRRDMMRCRTQRPDIAR